MVYVRYTHIKWFMCGTPTFNILCMVHPHSIFYVRYTHIKATSGNNNDIEPTSSGTLAADMPPFRKCFMHSEWVLAKGAVETLLAAVDSVRRLLQWRNFLPAVACSVCRLVLLSVFSVYQRQTARQSANAHSELCFPAPSSKLCHSWLRH